VPDGESVLADAEAHLLVSSYVCDTFKIFVGYPAAARDDEFAEVVYLSDANGHFGSAVDTLWGLVRAGRVPPTLIIGLGYQAARLRADSAVRMRDLIPPAPGSASPFLYFLESEVKQWVRDRFRVNSARTTYFGHSLGGLLGAHALLTSPASFDRYVLSSPSLWWEDYRMLAREEAWAAAHDDLRSEVFVGVGGAETATPRLLPSSAGPTAPLRDMVSDVREFAGRLAARGYPSLRLSCVVFPDEIHETMAQRTLSRGVRELLGRT
jgi:uncharacterized protein